MSEIYVFLILWVWFLCSYSAIPCFQRQALCQRLTTSPRFSADDQNTGHAIYRWQVYLTHTLLLSRMVVFAFLRSPTSIYSVTAWHVDTSIGVRKLLVLLDLWLPALHLMYMAGIDSVKASITPSWHAFRDFLASLRVFFVFMGSRINVAPSTNIVAGNYFDINNMKSPSKVPAATAIWILVVRWILSLPVCAFSKH